MKTTELVKRLDEVRRELGEIADELSDDKREGMTPAEQKALEALKAWHKDLIVYGRNWRDRAKSANALKEAAEVLFGRKLTTKR